MSGAPKVLGFHQHCIEPWSHQKLQSSPRGACPHRCFGVKPGGWGPGHAIWGAALLRGCVPHPLPPTVGEPQWDRTGPTGGGGLRVAAGPPAALPSPGLCVCVRYLPRSEDMGHRTTVGPIKDQVPSRSLCPASAKRRRGPESAWQGIGSASGGGAAPPPPLAWGAL